MCVCVCVGGGSVCNNYAQSTAKTPFGDNAVYIIYIKKIFFLRQFSQHSLQPKIFLGNGAVYTIYGKMCLPSSNTDTDRLID